MSLLALTPVTTKASTMRPTRFFLAAAAALVLVVLSGCTPTPEQEPEPHGPSDAASSAELPGDAGPSSTLFINARIYTFDWPEPARDGSPSPDAPIEDGKWKPDAQALLIEGGLVRWTGSSEEAESRRDLAENVIDLAGAVVVPGLVDSHTHVQGLGSNLRRVNLEGVETVDEVVRRLKEARSNVAPGEWIVGWGWDDGAWAANYPSWDALSEAFPDNPVVLHSLHSFALWGNRAAFKRAEIDRLTKAPVGGDILRDESGELTGILLNRATTLLTGAVPAPTGAELRADLEAGLKEMARSGYVSIHEAGLGAKALNTFRELQDAGQLPLRVYAMLSARDADLMEQYIASGPECSPETMLRICSVKAYWDGALGSRGARLLADYSDRPGHRGVSGEGYGFDQELVARSMVAGFQVGVHAIGDAGNRETLEFLAEVLENNPLARVQRHRVEHAQVVHPADIPRFAELGLIASMQPPHMAEDRAWAEDRLGPERIRGAYAWRTLRLAGAQLIFSSDLAGSDHNFFYGLHSAVARQSSDGTPEGGWYPDQALTVEETIRAYTSWAARAAFLENRTGVLREGAFADFTVIDIDPFATAAGEVSSLLDGRVLMTVAAGNVVFDGR